MTKPCSARRSFLLAAAGAPLLAVSLGACKGGVTGDPPPGPLSRDAAPATDVQIIEATIGNLQELMSNGTLSARAIVEKYIERIERLDKKGPMLSSVIEVNPDALTIPQSLDEERKKSGPRGPLHGIPVLVKDNIDTDDKMHTGAGSLALNGMRPAQDASAVAALRRAGAVILGKANLSEWSNFRSMNGSSGWSARGGQVKNPYILTADVAGSSTGSAVSVAANLTAVSLGTETNGSIISPCVLNGVVGIKPTVGLTSRAGVIPISHHQDTVGPVARTVTDAAILLGALTGIDPRDDATKSSQGKFQRDYRSSLNASGLDGARLGGMELSGVPDAVKRICDEKNATIIAFSDKDLARFPWDGNDETDLLLADFKHGINQYLATLKPDHRRPAGHAAEIRSLADIIEFNRNTPAERLDIYDQTLLLQADLSGPINDPDYVAAREKNRDMSRNFIDGLLDLYHLDALILPLAQIVPAGMAGYPMVTLPVGLDHRGLPTAVVLMGRAYSEPTLIRLAFGIEQALNAKALGRTIPAYRKS